MPVLSQSFPTLSHPTPSHIHPSTLRPPQDGPAKPGPAQPGLSPTQPSRSQPSPAQPVPAQRPGLYPTPAHPHPALSSYGIPTRTFKPTLYPVADHPIPVDSRCPMARRRGAAAKCAMGSMPDTTSGRISMPYGTRGGTIHLECLHTLPIHFSCGDGVDEHWRETASSCGGSKLPAETAGPNPVRMYTAGWRGGGGGGKAGGNAAPPAAEPHSSLGDGSRELVVAPPR